MHLTSKTVEMVFVVLRSCLGSLWQVGAETAAQAYRSFFSVAPEGRGCADPLPVRSWRNHAGFPCRGGKGENPRPGARIRQQL